jgi:pimeloyl-ACP methyl ester carboxylesterase
MPARQLPDPATNERNSRREDSVTRAGELLKVSRTVWLEDSIHDVPVQRPELVAGVIRDALEAKFFD